jgi:predicted AAA+ superfamily ATPase
MLQTSRVVYLLPPYYRNFGKRIRKSPKLYLLDPGLATYLLGLHTKESVLHGPSLGALAETIVVGEWLKAFGHGGEKPSLYYWQSSGDAEVDLIIERGGHLYALEIKATATPVPRHADSLAKWLELVGSPARGALACRVDEPAALRPGIRAVPWHLCW